MNQLDLFISHSSGDGDVARELRAELEAAGYSCWMAPDDVTGTDTWAEQILAAIRDSRAMLVLISSNSNRSHHVAREVGLASGRDRAVLPIRIEAVAAEGALEYHLAGLQRIDAFPPPISDHRDRILRRLARVVPLAPSATISEPAAPSPPEPPSAPPEAPTLRAAAGVSLEPIAGVVRPEQPPAPPEPPALVSGASVGNVPTAAVVPAPQPRAAGLNAWARANSMLTGSLATIAALVVVATLALATSSQNPIGSPEPVGSQGGVGPGPSASPPRPTASIAPPTATIPPSPSAPPTPSPSPTPSPTEPPRPTPTPDHKPPSGGKITINDGTALTTKTTVTVNVTTKPTDAAGIARYVWSTSSTRPSSGSKVYDRSFSASVTAGSDGTRTINVWFQDGEGNWSTVPVKDSITFDNAPVATQGGKTYSFDDAYFATYTAFTLALLNPGASLATDKDGIATLRVTKLWRIFDNGTTVDRSSALNAAGTTASFSVGSNYCPGYAAFKYGFTVKDTHDVARNGWFWVKVCDP